MIYQNEQFKAWFDSDRVPPEEFGKFDPGWSKYLHRIDGPAIEWRSGRKSYYLNGKRLEHDEWLDQTPLSLEEKTEYKLKYMIELEDVV